MKKLLMKGSAAVLSAVVFATNVVLANATETNFWKQRRLPNSPVQLASLPQNFNATLLPAVAPVASVIVSSRIRAAIPNGAEATLLPIIKALPLNAGSVRKISGTSKSMARTVIHIQDVHQNRDAQENIGKAVQSLIENKTVDLVALEGAFGPMDFSWVRSYPQQQAVKASADWLLQEHRISGPVHTAYTLRLARRGGQAQALPPFVGIDEKTHYDANVKAYRDSAPVAASYKEKLAQMQREIHDAKMQTFHTDLKEFDARVESYRAGAMSWGDYVRFLAKHEDRISFSPKMETFLAALDLEEKLNFSQVEAERTQLITKLVTKLSKPETDALLNLSVGYRLGNVGSSDFYTRVKELCAQKGIDLTRTPAMDSYIRYVLLSDSLDVDAIIEETTSVEQQLAATLATTDAEKQLLAEARLLNLTSKLLDFSLTKEEWKEYQRQKIENGKWKIDQGMINNFSPFEKFYSEAEARDVAMAENLDRAMTAAHAKVAVVVAGGFHSSGMLRELQSKGTTVISYAPKIAKVDDNTGSAYLSVFTQEKTPLDQLFAGEKLFLASKPALPPAALKNVVRGDEKAGMSSNRTSQTDIGGGCVLKIVVAATSFAILSVSLVKPQSWTQIPPVIVSALGLLGLGGWCLWIVFRDRREALQWHRQYKSFHLDPEASQGGAAGAWWWTLKTFRDSQGRLRVLNESDVYDRAPWLESLITVGIFLTATLFIAWGFHSLPGSNEAFTQISSGYLTSRGMHTAFLSWIISFFIAGSFVEGPDTENNPGGMRAAFDALPATFREVHDEEGNRVKLLRNGNPTYRDGSFREDIQVFLNSDGTWSIIADRFNRGIETSFGKEVRWSLGWDGRDLHYFHIIRSHPNGSEAEYATVRKGVVSIDIDPLSGLNANDHGVLIVSLEKSILEQIHFDPEGLIRFIEAPPAQKGMVKLFKKIPLEANKIGEQLVKKTTWQFRRGSNPGVGFGGSVAVAFQKDGSWNITLADSSDYWEGKTSLVQYWQNRHLIEVILGWDQKHKKFSVIGEHTSAFFKKTPAPGKYEKTLEEDPLSDLDIGPGEKPKSITFNKAVLGEEIARALDNELLKGWTWKINVEQKPRTNILNGFGGIGIFGVLSAPSLSMNTIALIGVAALVWFLILNKTTRKIAGRLLKSKAFIVASVFTAIFLFPTLGGFQAAELITNSGFPVQVVTHGATQAADEWARVGAVVMTVVAFAVILVPALLDLPSLTKVKLSNGRFRITRRWVLGFMGAGLVLRGRPLIAQALAPAPRLPTAEELKAKPYTYEITKNWRQSLFVDLKRAVEGTQNVKVVDDPKGKLGKMLEITYPEGSVDPAYSAAGKGPYGGTVFYMQAPASDKIHLSYYLDIPEGFDFNRTGKLPGLYGGAGVASGGSRTPNSWSTRFVWRGLGKGDTADGEVYLYTYGQTGYGKSVGKGSFGFDPRKGDVRYHIEQTLTLNTPGKADGKIEIWVDGTLVWTEEGIVFRTNASAKTDHVVVSTFFGGDDKSFMSRKNQKIRLGGFQVAAERTAPQQPVAPSPAQLQVPQNLRAQINNDQLSLSWDPVRTNPGETAKYTVYRGISRLFIDGRPRTKPENHGTNGYRVSMNSPKNTHTEKIPNLPELHYAVTSTIYGSDGKIVREESRLSSEVVFKNGVLQTKPSTEKSKQGSLLKNSANAPATLPYYIASSVLGKTPSERVVGWSAIFTVGEIVLLAILNYNLPVWGGVAAVAASFHRVFTAHSRDPWLRRGNRSAQMWEPMVVWALYTVVASLIPSENVRVWALVGVGLIHAAKDAWFFYQTLQRIKKARAVSQSEWSIAHVSDSTVGFSAASRILRDIRARYMKDGDESFHLSTLVPSQFQTNTDLRKNPDNRWLRLLVLSTALLMGTSKANATVPPVDLSQAKARVHIVMDAKDLDRVEAEIIKMNAQIEQKKLTPENIPGFISIGIPQTVAEDPSALAERARALASRYPLVPVAVSLDVPTEKAFGNGTPDSPDQKLYTFENHFANVRRTNEALDATVSMILENRAPIEVIASRAIPYSVETDLGRQIELWIGDVRVSLMEAIKIAELAMQMA